MESETRLPRRLGIDFGGTKIALGAVTDAGEISREWRLPTLTGADAPRGMENLLAATRAALAAFPSIRGIGVGICCQVDQETGRIDGADDTIPGWEALDPAARLGQATGLPVRMENDGNAAALGEGWVGAAQGWRDYVLLTVGTGVGGGIVAGGRLLRGGWGGAGELGHLPLDPAGPACYCGSTGCLEQLIAGPALDATARRLGLTGSRDLLAAADRDEGAAQAVRHAGRWLGVATVLLVNIFQPEAILYGGGVMEGAASHWLPLVQTALDVGTFPSNRRTRLLPPALSNRAGLIGAAALVELSP